MLDYPARPDRRMPAHCVSFALMTSDSFFPKNPRHGAERPQSNARLAAEAFFSAPRATVPDERSNAQVVVKRRRALAIDGPVVVPERPASAEPVERAPKVHLLSIPGGRGADHADGGQPAERPPVPDDRPRRRRGARRDLHGVVTIIRPQGEGHEDASAHPGPAKRLEHSQVVSAMERWPLSLRYPQLLAQIRALERQALEMKERERTIRWVSQAIRQHRLTRQDLEL